MRPRSLAVLALLVLALGAFLWFVDRDRPGSEEQEERSRQLLPDLDPEGVTAVEIQPAEGERIRLERPEPSAAPDEEEAPPSGEPSPPEAPAPGDRADEPEASVGAATRPASPASAASPLSPTTSVPPAWRFAAPAALAGEPADEAALDALLAALSGLVQERRLEDVEPADVGLEPPRLIVRLERIAEPALELRFGADVPASNHLILILALHRPATARTVHVVDRSLLTDLDRPPEAWRPPPTPAP